MIRLKVLVVVVAAVVGEVFEKVEKVERIEVNVMIMASNKTEGLHKKNLKNPLQVTT